MQKSFSFDVFSIAASDAQMESIYAQTVVTEKVKTLPKKDTDQKEATFSKDTRVRDIIHGILTSESQGLFKLSEKEDIEKFLLKSIKFQDLFNMTPEQMKSPDWNAVETTRDEAYLKTERLGNISNRIQQSKEKKDAIVVNIKNIPHIHVDDDDLGIDFI